MKRAKLVQKIFIVLIIAGLLLPSMSAVAIIPPSIIQPSIGLTIPPANHIAPATPTPSDPANVDPSNFLKPPTPPGGGGSRNSMNKLRAEDRKQCEAEATGKKNPTIGQAVAGAVTKPLKDSINEQLGIDAIPTAVNQTINSTASKAIEEELKSEIQEGVREGLKEEIPKTLAEKLAALKAEGVTEEDLRGDLGRFRGLINDSIRESLPRVLNEDFVGHRVSNAVDRGLRRSLQDNLRLNFNRVAKPTIETYYRAQINTMLAQIPDMVRNEIETVQATIEGTKAGLEGLDQGLRACFTDPICLISRGIGVIVTGDIEQAFPEIKQAKKLIENLKAQIAGSAQFLKWLKDLDPDKLVNDLIEGFSLQLEQSLTAPKNIEKLADAISGAISGPINESIRDSINQVMDSVVDPLETLESAIDSLDEVFLAPIIDAVDLQLNMAIANITKPVTVIIDHVGDTIAASIDNTVGAVLYPLAQGITDTAFTAGSAVADGINRVGYGLQDMIFPRPQISVVPDDFVGPLASNQMYQTQYDSALSEGIKVVPDSLTPRPGTSEMRFSDYQASLPANAPLTGVTDSVSATAAEATQNSAGQVAEQAFNNQGAGTTLTSDIAQGLKAGFGQTIAASVGSIFEGVPYVGPILAQVVERVIQEVMTEIGLAVAGGAGAIISVPVAEVDGLLTTTFSLLTVSQRTSRTTGKILSTEEQTKKLTEKILNLQIQACTNVKVVRRIQLLAEEKMFVWDPNARKAAARALNEHKDRLVEFFNRGYEVSAAAIGVPDAQGEKQPLYVQNIAEHLTDVTAEQTRIFLDQLKTLASDTANYPQLEDIRIKLEQEQAAADFADRIKPTIDQGTYETFTKPGGFIEGGGWDTWLKLIQPNNNPAGVEYLAREELARRQALAEENAREELGWGQGVLPPRECADEDRLENGDCRRWTIKTPAAVIREYMATILTSLVRQLEQSDKTGEDFLKTELPNLERQLEGLDQDNYVETLDSSIFKNQDPCPGPGPCPNSGWNL